MYQREKQSCRPHLVPSQGSSPDSGTSLSSRDATPAGRDQHKEEEEEESGEEEECGEEEEESGEEDSEEGESDEEESEEKDDAAMPACKKRPMFLLRRLVSIHTVDSTVHTHCKSGNNLTSGWNL